MIGPPLHPWRAGRSVRLRFATALFATAACACAPLARSAGVSGGNPAAGPGATYLAERDLVYADRAGELLRADLYLPRGVGPFPAVLVVHGGSWKRGKKEDMARVARRLAEDGFAALAINYRLAPAHRFPAQLDDCRAAVRWLRRNAERLHVDAARIGGFGYSAGGHLVALLATADEPTAADGTPTRIQAAVAGGAPADLRRFKDNPTIIALLGGTRTELPQQYADASPVSHVSPDDPPMFLYHGRNDWVVGVEQPRALHTALRAAGVPADLHETVLGHVGTFVFDDDVMGEALRFLDRWLRHRPAARAALPGPRT